MGLVIKTNRHYREVFFGCQLPESERKEFDYYETQEDLEGAMFFKYKGQYFDLAEFTKINPDKDSPMYGWDAGMHFTVWSGLVIKLSDCGDGVMVGYYYE